MAQIMVRVDEDTKSAVERLARSEGKTLSQIVRDLLRDYLRTRDMSQYIDSLWQRIGDRLRSGGARPEVVERIVRQVRAQK